MNNDSAPVTARKPHNRLDELYARFAELSRAIDAASEKSEASDGNEFLDAEHEIETLKVEFFNTKEEIDCFEDRIAPIHNDMEATQEKLHRASLDSATASTMLTVSSDMQWQRLRVTSRVLMRANQIRYEKLENLVFFMNNPGAFKQTVDYVHVFYCKELDAMECVTSRDGFVIGHENENYAPNDTERRELRRFYTQIEGYITTGFEVMGIRDYREAHDTEHEPLAQAVWQLEALQGDIGYLLGEYHCPVCGAWIQYNYGHEQYHADDFPMCPNRNGYAPNVLVEQHREYDDRVEYAMYYGE